MSGPKYPGFDTLALHAGQSPDAATGARAVPIYQTTSFVFRDSEHAASLFNMERAGHIYSRISNPTVAVLEERMAALEGGVGAIATASGQAALHLAVATLMGSGGHIVASNSLYGGSHNLLGYTLSRFGIETTFIDPRELEHWRRAAKPNTRLFFGETLGNPGLDVLDIPEVSKLAHQHGVPLLVDATFTTPWLMKPFELGADLLYHSATKFLGGHGVAIGGVLVDSGRFDWEASGKFETLSAPYPGFHNMDFEEESGTRAFLLRARREGLRDFGACMAPMTAFQILQGVETLHLRMPRHVENARKVVAFLAEHPLVETVMYPELASHPDHALCRRLLPRGAGAVFSFNMKGGRDAGRRFIESLRVFSHLANVGDAKSLVIHPATTTHYRVSDEDLKKAGITAGTVRLSIGLEDADDLVEDLGRALAAAGKA
ncbi:MAG: O-acetylhomoserine aminocarboxypropyltransferase [Betaproteobacteria bacterium]|nr:O-acetylhomoserine aminocarboxypropyltransferase [Betaproteobacteria bacterium]